MSVALSPLGSGPSRSLFQNPPGATIVLSLRETITLMSFSSSWKLTLPFLFGNLVCGKNGFEDEEVFSVVPDDDDDCCCDVVVVIVVGFGS